MIFLFFSSREFDAEVPIQYIHNIVDIAIDSGFSNSHAFVTFFKKQYGMLPKDYRREQKKKKENTAQRVEQHNYIYG